jgi:hypothetical protein
VLNTRIQRCHTLTTQTNRHTRTHNSRLHKRGHNYKTSRALHDQNSGTRHDGTKPRSSSKAKAANRARELHSNTEVRKEYRYTSQTVAAQPAFRQPSTVALTMAGGHPAVATHLSYPPRHTQIPDGSLACFSTQDVNEVPQPVRVGELQLSPECSDSPGAFASTEHGSHCTRPNMDMTHNDLHWKCNVLAPRDSQISRKQPPECAQSHPSTQEPSHMTCSPLCSCKHRSSYDYACIGSSLGHIAPMLRPYGEQ